MIDSEHPDDMDDPGHGDGPLAGIVVVDLTRALAGPTCTALLGDLGADVIKVEGLPAGDGARSWSPFDGDDSLYFASINRNKSSVAISLRDDRGRAVLEKLIASADVLIENFRPGTLGRMGFPIEELRRKYPRLVIASLSGFGSKGPAKNAPGLDQVAQGMSGLMSITGYSDSSPTRVGVPIVDSITGVVGAVAISAGLAGRERTGQGAHVETSLLESAINMLSFQAQQYLSLGEVPARNGNDHPVIWPYGTFATADDDINIAAGSEAQWVALCDVLGEPGLATREGFADGRARLTRREDVRVEVERLLAAQGAEAWIPALRDAGIPVGPVHRMDQVFADPQVQALEMVQGITTDAGKRLDVLRGPLTVNGMPLAVRKAPPSLGQDSRAVLRRVDIPDREIEELITAGVIGTPH
ncbi:MAG: CoA transferase [Nocardioidaceae bacterium]|nr:CoA transferase [Nocardioidaceae bacterium]